MDDMDAEGRFVRMDFEGGLSVASLYVPSGTTGPARQAVKEAFLDRFITNLVQMKNEAIRSSSAVTTTSRTSTLTSSA